MSRSDYEIAPEDLRRKLDGPVRPVVVDVRRHDEVSTVPFPGALHVPMDELQDRLDELDPNAETVVVCHHGVRSLSVTVFSAKPRFPFGIQPGGRHRQVVAGRRPFRPALLRPLCCGARANRGDKVEDPCHRNRS